MYIHRWVASTATLADCLSKKVVERHHYAPCDLYSTETSGMNATEVRTQLFVDSQACDPLYFAPFLGYVAQMVRAVDS